MADLANIDIGCLFSGNREDRNAVDARIGQAVLEHGGFLISNYPDADRIDARASRMLSFFALGEDDKRAVGSKAIYPEGKRVYRGYVSTLEPNGWAYNEFFDIGPERPSDGPAIEGMAVFSEENIWPETEPCPGWKQTMRDYYDHLHLIATAVMLSAGRFAGFSEQDLRARFRDGNSTLRLLNYPARPEGNRVAEELPDDRFADDEELALSAGRHVDAAGVSILWQRQPGLQAQGPDGTWRDVPMIENCLSVHLGSVMEIMTEGRVPATPHRVIDHGANRQSIGFFLEPGLGAQLAPITAGAHAPASVTGTYGWHLQDRFHHYSDYADLIPSPKLPT